MRYHRLERKKEIIDSTIDSLRSRESWLHGRMAEDPAGNPVHECSPDACRFCLTAALVRSAFGTHNDPTYRNPAEERRRSTEYGSVLDDVIADAYRIFPTPIPEDTAGLQARLIVWNDAEGRLHDEVLEVLRTVRRGYGE